MISSSTIYSSANNAGLYFADNLFAQVSFAGHSATIPITICTVFGIKYL